MSPPPPRHRTAVLADLEEARLRVEKLEAELAGLSTEEAPTPSSSSRPNPPSSAPGQPADEQDSTHAPRDWPLSLREYKRYGRQMMLSGIGLPGQLKLKRAHILVVGAGGLGCPVLLYLAAAGVGEITILDHDTVELSNLHRQVLHTEGRVGMSKAESAKVGLEALNSDITVHAYAIPFIPSIFHSPLSASTPPSVLAGTFSLILDCTDNPPTRHFLNAYAVAHEIPLVSGGAVRAEGTVGAYGVPLKPAADAVPGSTSHGPCYACIFPPAPPPAPAPQWDSLPANEVERAKREREEDAYYQRLSLAGTGACSDEGVLGILCGVVGIGMAAEAVKMLLGTALPSLHLFSPLSPSSPYRTIKTRSRKPTCAACGTFPSLSPPPSASDSSEVASAEASALSTPASRWQAFLSSPSGSWPGWSDPLCAVPGIGAREMSGRSDERIGVDELRRRVEKGARVVDTRPEAEFGIASVEGSVNVPFAKLLKDPSLALAPLLTPSAPPPLPPASDDPEDLVATTHPAAIAVSSTEPERITFICRRGNDSLLAARAVKRYLAEEGAASGHRGEVEVEDVRGGLVAWAEKGEEGFPMY
ncbi:hypothetical protein JCM10207_003672 [Rhodosporidiobolus poonsookiae]